VHTCSQVMAVVAALTRHAVHVPSCPGCVAHPLGLHDDWHELVGHAHPCRARFVPRLWCSRSTQTYCLLSCSATAIASSPNGGVTDPTAYCQKFADPTFTCSSSGGGRNNQQFCGP
jgi:hypothetical protein